ncbi:LysR family transcriptional regulator [Sphingomonas bisphenolicum]
MPTEIEEVRRLDARRKRSLNLKEIDLASLRVFAAAAREGTLARAADRENIAISAVSRRIADLEWRCGVKLLERHDRGVTATAGGQIMLRHVDNLFGQVERMILDMDALRGGDSGHVRVHAHMSAASGLLPNCLANFIAEHPSIEISLDVAASHDVISAIRGGDADLGVVSGTIDGGDLLLIPWVSDELVAIMKADHPLAQRDVLTLSDMLSEPFVGVQRDSAIQTLCRSQAAALGRSFNERVHTTSFESVRKMVSLGLGVGILPAAAVFPFMKELNIVARPLQETWAKHPLMLCIRDTALLSGATSNLLEYLLDQRG